MNTELPPLTDEEIRTYLGTENHQIINSLYALVLNLYAGETERTKALDGKAASLFGFVGAFISAIFVVLGLLGDSKNAKLAAALSGTPLVGPVSVLILLGIALMALFLSVVVKRGWKVPGDRDLFEAIHKYDGHVKGARDNHTKPDHDYKRHLIEHFWKLYRTGSTQNEEKAKALFWGQLFVFLGLGLLIAVQVKAVITFGTIMDTPKPQNTTSSSTTQETTSVSTAPIPPLSPAVVVPGEPGQRPVPLEASSAGKNVRLSEERPSALKASSDGKSIRNNGDAKPSKKGN